LCGCISESGDNKLLTTSSNSDQLPPKFNTETKVVKKCRCTNVHSATDCTTEKMHYRKLSAFRFDFSQWVRWRVGSLLTARCGCALWWQGLPMSMMTTRIAEAFFLTPESYNKMIVPNLFFRLIFLFLNLLIFQLVSAEPAVANNVSYFFPI
jgi:hypothetical protein